MKNTLRTLTAIAFAGFFALASFADSKVDIGIYQVNGNLEIKLRPQVDFDGIFSAVVFTVRWDKNSNAALGDIKFFGNEMIPLAKSGHTRDNGLTNYQVFSGVGHQTLEALGMEWEAGKEYTLLTIPYTGAAEFELVNDAWTDVVEHNANYYVSLGGKDVTGTIYKGSTGMAQNLDNTVLIQPNPNSGVFTFSFAVREQANVDVEVINTLGQVMYTESLADFSGRHTREIDLTDESNGVYYLKLKDGDDVSVHKVIFR